jgi:GT2 family glycosyltransferase
MRAGKRFGAVIVNYNCGLEALDAALSFLGAGGATAIIVDNASTDGSADAIEAAISGARPHTPAPPPAPIAGKEPKFASLRDLPTGAIRLIRTARNGGFAFGCNTGLRALAAIRGIDRLALLNPDALVSEDALEAFADRLADERVGLCGATVVEFDAPHRIQCFGGASLHPALLIGRNIGEGAAIADLPSRSEVEAVMSYPLGAAIALRKDYLVRAGYLDERYFLYYEEADWAFAGGATNRPGWARDAVIYHRYGSASKSRRRPAGEPSERSAFANYQMTRSRTLFAAKWRPPLAPLSIVVGCAQAAARALRGRRANAIAVFRACFPWRAQWRPHLSGETA